MTTVDDRPDQATTAVGDRSSTGFHQCWYVVARSSELEDAPLLSKEFLGGRVVVYRTADGSPVVLAAYCAHVGADLGVGDLEGEEVVCAFHHFRYGPDGRCTGVPGTSEIPEKARVFSYPVVEQWGAIWAFNGPEPLYDPPAWRDYEPEQLVTRVRETEQFSVEPWIMITNSWDFLHLRELHGIVFDEEPTNIATPNPYVHEYDTVFDMPNIGSMQQRIRQCGTNTVALCATVNGEDSMAMFSGTPLRDGLTASYSFAATANTRDGSAEQDEAVEMRLAIQEAFSDQLLADDIPVLSTLRFREGALLPDDRMLARYLRFVRQYPRMDPGEFCD
jgi:phenylpropionate dioxygenase-like ring-hydroxylating dioxygenase large terminal subunit